MLAQQTLSNLHFGLDQIGGAEEGQSTRLFFLRLDVLKYVRFFQFLNYYFKEIIIYKKWKKTSTTHFPLIFDSLAASTVRKSTSPYDTIRPWNKYINKLDINFDKIVKSKLWKTKKKNRPFREFPPGETRLVGWSWADASPRLHHPTIFNSNFSNKNYENLIK
jgi:hypothetical protein